MMITVIEKKLKTISTLYFQHRLIESSKSHPRTHNQIGKATKSHRRSHAKGIKHPFNCVTHTSSKGSSSFDGAYGQERVSLNAFTSH